ncbi:DEAD/DEAH box helicase family protein [Dokdonia sp.]|uniref:DEAD/DEAH box helicase family protein n=1 Tax=Dokdonia sp. TaxID=2024995 RepID=UPI0032646377
MLSLEKTFQFKYAWRSYQHRFLEKFDLHFEDAHLHVVAPPGSGKTVLGLEMIRRVNQKTIVLAPTLTIRNQWEERMFECFVDEETCDIPLSRNIKQPAHITFTTYQSLHAFFKNEMEGDAEKLVAFFAKANIKNIVLDEAHHLKNEWWKPLFALKALPTCSLIALTATPPYDSSQREIAKYFELCGPIDVEIGVPELVKEGNLCPHQDYIHFSEPDDAQIKYIKAFREKVQAFVHELIEDPSFKNFILQHPFYAKTDTVLEAIYDQPDLYAAILIYLNAAKTDILPGKVALLGIETEIIAIPVLTFPWMAVLLESILVTDRASFPEQEVLLKKMENSLRKIGAFDKQQILLEGNKELYTSLTQSPNKLKSIQEIISFESEQLKNGLRAVILADYIRKEFLESIAEEDLPTINKLGVVPIFHYLRASLARDPEKWQEENKQEKLAVLTGTLVIVHDRLREHIAKEIPEDYYTVSPLGETDFLILRPKEKGKSHIVSVMTALFTKGHIEVLIGTTSLLGEGWDAPAINTLVLASYVGSFVMSNQMRGRAIRVYPKYPDKVASVWHLACIDPTNIDGGEDLKKLYHRFDAFCGISLQGQSYVENGSDRFALPKKEFDATTLNERMFSLAMQREEVKLRWKHAITTGNILVRELKLDFNEVSQTTAKTSTKQRIYLRKVIELVVIEVLFLVLCVLSFIAFSYTSLSRSLTVSLLIIFIGGFIKYFPKMQNALQLFLKYGQVDKALYKIGKTLLHALYEKKLINTSFSKVTLEVQKNGEKEVTCFISGATVKEEVLFVNSLREIVQAIDNPRYMIKEFDGMQKTFGFPKYYGVPSVFAERKKDATLFLNHWQRHKGKAILIFTRNKEGRKKLLKARFHYLNTEGGFKTKTAAIWK